MLINKASNIDCYDEEFKKILSVPPEIPTDTSGDESRSETAEIPGAITTPELTTKSENTDCNATLKVDYGSNAEIVVVDIPSPGNIHS